jgi:hypothetical protein
MMKDKLRHHEEVIEFLENHLSRQHWRLALPTSGRGQETYVATAGERSYFVKLGVDIPRYEIMASLGLTPEVIASGCLSDDISIIVQPFLPGRNPSWGDFQRSLNSMAAF